LATNKLEHVRFGILIAVILYDLPPCSLAVVYRSFEGIYCLHLKGTQDPEDGGNMSVNTKLHGFTSQKTIIIIIFNENAEQCFSVELHRLS
jgi:hypothetical protein